MTFTADHLRALLAADPGAQLAVHEGRATVLTADEAGAPEYRGALAVISHDELCERLGDHEPSDELLGALALRFDSAVGTLGA